jgi:hypothetical protein
MPFPVLHDAGGKVSDEYGVEAIPTLFIVSKNGDLIYTNTGLDMSLEFMLAQQLGIKNYVTVETPAESGK